jgi:hypothetical protein
MQLYWFLKLLSVASFINCEYLLSVDLNECQRRIPESRTPQRAQPIITVKLNLLLEEERVLICIQHLVELLAYLLQHTWLPIFIAVEFVVGISAVDDGKRSVYPCTCYFR